MMRLYDINDTSSAVRDKNDGNQNLAVHMEEGDGIFQSEHNNNRRIDAAYMYHPNDVVPRKKKTRKQPRTVFTCLAKCTSSTSSSSSSSVSGSRGHSHMPNSSWKNRQCHRRRMFSLVSLAAVCITVVAVWYTQEAKIVSDLGNDSNHNNAANGKLPKILQFDHDNDPNYFEPETKIIVAPTTSSTPSGNNVTHPGTPSCIDNVVASFDFVRSNASWSAYGQELVQYISDKHGVANSDGGQYAKHYGYGNNVIVSSDGTMMAISYAGVAGFDKAFGTHIDMVRFHPVTQQWTLEQTVTNVKRSHGYVSTDILFQSMILSYNGQRLFFADGHDGVHVFEYDPNHITNGSKSQLPWKKLVSIADPYLQQHNNSKQYQFGIDLATNCDGTMVAISGTTSTNSYTRIYHQESNTMEWILVGEIQNVRFGGNIVMDRSGTRLVIGTVASEGWRGMVQVFDYQPEPKSWVRVGPPIVGQKPLDMWGGKLALSYDGNTLAVTSKNGDTNHVQVYQLSAVTNGPFWVPIGQELVGTGNAHEHYGSDIALSADGTVLAVGAPGDNDLYHAMANGKNISSHDRPFMSGRIYLYQLFQNNSSTNGVTWVRTDHNDLISKKEGDLYGYSVSLSSNGQMVVGGAPRRTGKAYQHILGGVHGYVVSPK